MLIRRFYSGSSYQTAHRVSRTASHHCTVMGRKERLLCDPRSKCQKGEGDGDSAKIIEGMGKKKVTASLSDRVVASRRGDRTAGCPTRRYAEQLSTWPCDLVLSSR